MFKHIKSVPEHLRTSINRTIVELKISMFSLHTSDVEKKAVLTDSLFSYPFPIHIAEEISLHHIPVLHAGAESGELRVQFRRFGVEPSGMLPAEFIGDERRTDGIGLTTDCAGSFQVSLLIGHQAGAVKL